MSNSVVSLSEDDARQALLHWFAVEPVELRAFGEGHINSTWLVELPADEQPAPRYVLQKISQTVFSRPPQLMANLGALFDGKAAVHAAELSYVLPQPLAALSGSLLVSSGQETLAGGEVVDCSWRLSRFIERTQTLQVLMNAQQAQAAGLAFGEFQRWLEYLAGVPLAEVIPDFHQLDGYLAALGDAVAAQKKAVAAQKKAVAAQKKAVAAQKKAVAAEKGTETDSFATREHFLLAQLQTRNYLDVARSGGETATCVIHGDCKVNNLLFADDASKVVAILDLDTLMRGPWWLDFGDLVRSAACTDGGDFQRDFYPALVDGFFAGRLRAADSECDEGFDLNDALQAPAYMTFMLCVRFLTDHLQGDRYFNVAQRGENLQRAERQFRLLETLELPATTAFMFEVLKRYL